MDTKWKCFLKICNIFTKSNRFLKKTGAHCRFKEKRIDAAAPLC